MSSAPLPARPRCLARPPPDTLLRGPRRQEQCAGSVPAVRVAEGEKLRILVNFRDATFEIAVKNMKVEVLLQYFYFKEKIKTFDREIDNVNLKFLYAILMIIWEVCI